MDERTEPPSPPEPDDGGAADDFERRSAPLFARLEALGIATTTTRHEAVFTVGEAQAHRGPAAGAHTKNLLLKDKKSRLFLVVAEEGRSVDLRTLHARIGAGGRLSFAGPDRMREQLGVEPGSLTAFALLNDIRRAVTLVLDEDLLRHDILNCHPLSNRATTAIARDDLLKFFAATGHDPLVVRLDDVPRHNDDETVTHP